MPRTLVVKLDKDLPRRASAPGTDALSKVMGGCAGVYQPCNTESDCCLSSDRRRGLKISCTGYYKPFFCNWVPGSY